jgi:hypothetical protein
MTIKKIKSTNEDQAQAYICSWCLQNNLIPVAVPNGFNLGGVATLFKAHGLSMAALNGINAKQIKLLKKEGLHTGFPDLIIFGRSGNGKNILFMENKVKGNKPSEIQIACHEWLRSIDFTVEVSKDSIDAIQKIKKYFGTSEQKENVLYAWIRRNILEKLNKERGAK